MLLQDAYALSQKLLDELIRPEHEPEIVISACEEKAENWIFYYDTRAALEGGDVMSALVGNGPVVVPKSGEPPYIGSVFPDR